MATTLEALLKLKADVVGEGAVGSLAKGIGNLHNAASGASGGFSKFAGSAGGLISGLQSLVPLATGAGLVAMAKGAIDAADNFRDMSQKTGISVEQLSRFQQAAEKSGTTIDKVAGAAIKLNKGLADGKAAETLKEMGINAYDASGKLKSTDQIMLEVADKFKSMPDGAKKTALAMALFGKSGADLIPLLNGGSEAIKSLSATMTTDFANKADEFNDKLVDLQTGLAKIGVELGAALMPILSATTDALVALVQGFGSLPAPVQQLIGGIAALMIAWGPVSGAFSAIVGIITTIGPLFTGLGAIIAGWAGAIGPLLAGVGSAFSGLLPILAGVFTGPVGWIALIAGAIAALVYFREPIANFFTWIGEALGNWIKSLWEWGEPIRQFWMDLWAKVQEIATTFFTWFGQILYDWFLKPWVDLGKLLLDAALQLWEQIKGPVTAFFTWFGESLYKLFVEPWIKIGQALIDAASQAWTGIKSFVQGFFQWFLDSVNAYLVTPISNALQAIGQFFSEAWNAIQEMVVGVWTKIQEAISSFFSWLGGAAKTYIVDPIANAMTAIAQFFSDAWTKIKDAVSGFFTWYLDSVKKYLLQPVSDALSGIGKLFSEVWGSVKAFIVGWFQWWGDFLYKAFIEPVQLALTKLGDLFKAGFDKLSQIAKDAWDAVQKAWQTAVDAISKAMGAVAKAFADNVVKPIGEGWKNLIASLTSLAGELASKLQAAWNGITKAFSDYVITPIKTAWSGLSTTLADAMKTATNAITTIWNGIKSNLTTAFQAIGNAFNQYVVTPLKSAWEGISTTISNSLNGAVQAVQKAYSAIAGAVTGAFKGVIGTVGGIINSVINAINKLIGAVNKVRSAVGLSTFSLIPNVSIPSYAKGGLVNRPTLAMVGEGGEPEYIIPSSKMAQAAQNYLQGMRGESILSARPGGGMGSSGAGSVVAIGGGATSVNITTGPIQQVGGEQYVTLADLQKAVTMTAKQVQDQIMRDLAQPSTRQRLGMA